MRKLTQRDRTDLGTASVAIRYLQHLKHSQDHRLTDGETRKLTAAIGALRTMAKRIENGIEP